MVQQMHQGRHHLIPVYLPQGNYNFPEKKKTLRLPGLTDDLDQGLDAPLVADFSQNVGGPHSGGCHRMTQGPHQFLKIAALVEGEYFRLAVRAYLFVLSYTGPTVRAKEYQTCSLRYPYAQPIAGWGANRKAARILPTPKPVASSCIYIIASPPDVSPAIKLPEPGQ